jgi:hypothetical protein
LALRHFAKEVAKLGIEELLLTGFAKGLDLLFVAEGVLDIQ